MIAVLVMALCIGAATSLFTVVRSVLLRPLPFRDPARLVMVYRAFPRSQHECAGVQLQLRCSCDYYDWRANPRL
jgi:hypothetical protein